MEIAKDTLFEKFGNLRNELEMLAQQQRVAIEQRDFLQTSYSDLESEYFALKEKFEKERSAQFELRTERLGLEEDRKQLEIRQAELIGELDKLFQERNVLMKLCDQQNTKYEKFRARIRKIWKNFGVTRLEADTNRRRVGRLEQMINDLKIENEALRISLSSHQSALEEVKQKQMFINKSEQENIQSAQALREEFERTSEDLVRARRQVTETEVRLARIEAQTSEEIARLKSELREKQDLFEVQVNAATENIKLERQTLKAELAEANQNIRLLDEQSETLNSRIQSLEKDFRSKTETLKEEHDRIVYNLNHEHELKIRKMTGDHEALTHSLVYDRKQAIDEAVSEYVELIRVNDERFRELQAFANKHVEENQRLTNEHSSLLQGAQIAHMLERETLKLREENKGLRQSFTGLQSLWDNSLLQREDSAERETRYKSAQEELLTALAIAQKSAEELRERLKCERHENSKVLSELTMELEDLRREKQVQRSVQRANHLTSPHMASAADENNPKQQQIEEFYSKWGRKISQVASQMVSVTKSAQEQNVDYSQLSIPEPPRNLKGSSRHEPQLYSEQGDLSL